MVHVVAKGERPPSVPILVAAPDKGAWPRVLKTSAAAIAAGDKPALHRHVREALAGKRRRAKVASVPAPDHATARDWPLQQF